MENKSQKKIFTVATAHLDTIWNWSLETTIRVFIKKTLEENFKLFEKYPDYKFNFEGAYRYELMEEYYPELFEKLKKYVAEGRWYPCGSSYENGDVNVPSPEALFRNILLGNGYFDKKFGIRSKDIFLPDCFGFGWHLPAVMHHANLLGFSTQKLTWGSVFGIPFDLGKWYGSNGDFVYAAINMNGYGQTFKEVRNFNFIRKSFERNKVFGIDAVAAYHGTGDTGGSPQEKSVACVEKEITDNNKSDTIVCSSRIDDVYEYLKELDDSYLAKLPSHKSELTLVFHGVGSYTSRAIGKRWNKRNEILGDVAERVNVAASALGEKEYPAELLTKNWKRVIAHQFHDDITGTSLQHLYKRCWNDYMVSLNGFSQEIDSATQAIARRMHTDGEGTPVIVSNSLEKTKRAAVKISFSSENEFFTVKNASGEVVPSQVNEITDGVVTLVFIATVAPFGVEKYTVLPAEKPQGSDALSVSDKTLENQKYSVRLDDNGDICSVFDKVLDKELLVRPVRYDIFKYDGSEEYPAWEIPYNACNSKRAPEHPSFVSSRVLEKGAARVAIEVVQKYGDSLFTSIVSLENGGERVDVQCETDWRSFRKLLKVDFGVTSANPYATFDLGIGTIKRWNNKKNCYEMSAQNWADLSNKDYGVSILSECKYGWDKPADDTLRLTILHTPKYYFHMKDSQQHKMELGLNRYGFAIYSHTGEVGADTQEESKRFISPMPAYLPSKHDGDLGTSYTYADFDEKGVLISCFKKAENGEEIVVRLVESDHRSHEKVSFGLNGGILSAKEIFASEEEKGSATVENGKLVFDLKPYEVKSFALTVTKAEQKDVSGVQVELPDVSPATTTNGDRRAVVLPGTDFSIPAELWKDTLLSGGKKFSLAGVTVCKGQTVALPENTKNVHILMTALEKNKKAKFSIGETSVETDVAAYNERIGIWDLIGCNETAAIRTDSVAYEFTHTHSANGDNIAKQFYLFRYDFAASGNTLTLPDDEKILAFAITTDEEEHSCIPCEVLFDTVEKRPFDYKLDRITKYNDRLRNRFGTKEYLS